MVYSTGNAVMRNSNLACFAKRASGWCKEEKVLSEYTSEHPPERFAIRVRTVAPVTAQEFVGTP
jgi:hypothetical protein